MKSKMRTKMDHQALRMKKLNNQGQERQKRRESKEPALLMQIVQLQTRFVLSLAFVNVRIISLVMRNVGREARVGEVKMVLKKRYKVL